VRKTIYIAGPMRGIPQFNFPAFDAAAARFLAAGYAVINPADLDRAADPERAVTTDEQATANSHVYARRDLLAILDHADAIALLPGWAKSVGATAEYHVAKWLGLDIYDAETLQLMPAAPAVILPQDKKARKERPITRGVLDYFPRAIAEVAHCSWVGNQQHNPGEPLHWAKEKSTDHADCITRHLIERGTVDDDGVRHSAKVAWRALAMLETELAAT
jgi:hypothetical protein